MELEYLRTVGKLRKFTCKEYQKKRREYLKQCLTVFQSDAGSSEMEASGVETCLSKHFGAWHGRVSSLRLALAAKDKTTEASSRRCGDSSVVKPCIACMQPGFTLQFQNKCRKSQKISYVVADIFNPALRRQGVSASLRSVRTT